jgi:type IV pilus assembly protein PilY1
MSKSILGSAVVVGLLAVASSALAKKDIAPPPPNVLLLVDDSGSMEYKSSSAAFPACDPTGGTASEKSRWTELVEVLTGSIEDYRCQAVDRSSNAFATEFGLTGSNPPDYYYDNPYHRPMSKDCTPTPGTLPSPNAYDFPANAIRYGKYNALATNCGFNQKKDGLLDDGAFRKSVRFGLMTFDTETDPGTGVIGTAPNYVTGTVGAWSYFVGTSKTGNPAACSTSASMEVGARNAAAPPWEGRMVAFGPPTSKPDQRNDRIQEILLATRPYGGTPIAGMLDDARGFLWSDTSTDPMAPSEDFGPKNDPFVNGGCRKNFIILLSDGEPNLDLRPSCEGAGPPAGNCPYDKAEDIAFDLANTGNVNKRVDTFVIGFAVSNVTLSSGTPVDCTTLTTNDLTNAGGLCATNPNEKELQACCTLSRIAYNGGTDRAYFANDKSTLRAALSAILSSLSVGTSSRTLPVFSSIPGGASAGTGPAGFRFYSSFKPNQFSLWDGILERQRITCKPDMSGNVQPQLETVDHLQGDDFVRNVNSGAGPARQFWTVIGSDVGGKIYSDRTIRPKIGSDLDGLGSYSGTAVWGDAETFNSSTPPAAINVDATTCTPLSATQCRDRFVRWLDGADNSSPESRCKSPGAADCSLIGDIYHSTPRVVARPTALLRDESYTLFTLKQAQRHTVLYTSTNDGFLHGFKVASGDPTSDPVKVDKEENNELWAFVPPAVLPLIQSEYPPAHQSLLDGVPVVEDVIAVENPAGSGNYRFERSGVDARAGKGQWRTVLVQSFGDNRSGYFAVDITDPVVPADPNDPTKGPKFLWQLQGDSNGNSLFGAGGPTPLITSLYYDTGGGDVKEVAVAVLPGGPDPDGPIVGQQVTRLDPAPSNVDTNFPVRNKVPKYNAGNGNYAARSISIVRLDTGEVIRTFWADQTKAPGNLDANGRVLDAKLDSPITGTPVAFPGTTGAVSDRIFVGDADGAMWRMDVSSANPDNWTMKLFFDAYSGLNYDEGQPIVTPPVLSVDQLGAVTLAFSTGDQDQLLAQSGMKTFAFSLTETRSPTGWGSKANWDTRFDDGERVTGPMTLFNGALFFTSYKPEKDTALTCSDGTSRVWGVDYLVPKTLGGTTAAMKDGGKERMPDGAGGFVQYLDNTAAMLTNAGVIFGVGVAQMPSCAVENGVTDSFLGSGTHTSLTSITPGTFQLVMQVSGIGNTNDSTTKRVEINLPTPPSSARIDSWAAIVE